MNNKILSSLLIICLYIYGYQYSNIFFYILIGCIFIFILLKKQYKFIIINIFIIAIITISLNYHNKVYECNFNNYFRVYEIHENYALVKQNNHKFLIYFNDLVLHDGNIIKIDGDLQEINKNGIPYLFSFDEYLANKDVYYQIEYTNIKIINNNISKQDKIIMQILNRIKYSKSFLNLLIFNNKSSEIIDLYDDLIKISAIQLFVISGFHITFLSNILDKILFKITKRKQSTITIFIIFIYVYLLKFSLSSLRSFLVLVYRYIDKFFKLKLNSIDINSLVAIIFLIIQPKNLFLAGFQLSFFISISILLISSFKFNYSYLLKIIIPFLISLPIILNMNSEVGILNIFMNYLLTPIISIIYILGIIVLIFPFLDLPFYFIVIGLESIINIIENINFYINFPHISIYGILILYIIIYYIIVYIYLKDKRNLYINISTLCVFLTIWYIKPLSSPYIIFFDVGQGDSCLIHGENNEYNILIDTGGNIYSDVATKRLIPYFIKDGIKRLDLVIITHLDFDHYGALESLQKNFFIEKIIIDTKYENIYFNELHILNLNQYYDTNDDENIKSSVLLFEFIDLKFLLMGDAPIEIENKIIDNNELDIDVLKVGHHGSNTSTSYEIVRKIKPEIAIISVGKNNRYGHPNKEVLSCLNYHNVKIFRTDIDGSIKISKNIWNELIIYKKL